MKLGNLLTEEREFILRSLAFCGVHFVVSLSNVQGRFQISEIELAEKEIKEIHLKENLEMLNEKIEELGFALKGIVDEWRIYAPEKLVLHAEGFSGRFYAGDKVQLNIALENSSAGTIAFVLERWDDNIIKIKTDKGDFIDLLERESIDHLIFIS